MSKNLNSEEIIKVISQERHWCKEHSEKFADISKEWKSGFDAGLLQAMYLINKMATVK